MVVVVGVPVKLSLTEADNWIKIELLSKFSFFGFGLKGLF